MKKILFVALAFYALQTNAQYTKATLQASGLTCSMCNKAIYKALTAVDFVDSIWVDVKNSSYTIAFKPNENIEFDKLQKAVSNAGFAVAKMQIHFIANNVSVENNTHIKLGNHFLHFVNVPSKKLDGEVTVTLLDKNFTSIKIHKQYNAFTKMECFKTGIMESCCNSGKDGGKRVYHVTI
jgi:copper chaperone CopZ